MATLGSFPLPWWVEWIGVLTASQLLALACLEEALLLLTRTCNFIYNPKPTHPRRLILVYWIHQALFPPCQGAFLPQCHGRHPTGSLIFNQSQESNQWYCKRQPIFCDARDLIIVKVTNVDATKLMILGCPSGRQRPWTAATTFPFLWGV
jgi:hypothetical protein